MVTTSRVNNPRSFTVNWTQVEGAIGYELFLFHSPQFPMQIVTVIGGQNLSHTFDQLIPFDYTSSLGVTFGVSVSGYDADGTGPQSDSHSVRLPCKSILGEMSIALKTL